MALDSLSFLFLALPCSLLLCRLCPSRFRSAVLLLISATLYAWAEGEYLWLLFSVILFDYGMTRLLEHCRDFPVLRRAILISSIVKSVGLFAFYGVWETLDATPFPLGLGVVCLTSLGYVIECYNGFMQSEHNPVNFALMNLFFPKLYAGPLVSAGKIVPQLRTMRMTLAKTGTGAELLIRGLAKKVILGESTYGVYESLRVENLYEMTALTAWTLVIMFAFSTYFILSGYCDMAKGIGLMHGFELPDNFHHPYSATSINDFFARFNITVNKFIRRNVYFNLGGGTGSTLSGMFNVLLVTMLMGLWFGIRLNTLIWGVYFAVFVLLERYFLRKYLDMIPTLFRWCYTVVVVMVSFVIFAGDTPQTSMHYLRLMFRVSAGGMDGTTVYLLTSNFLVLIAAALCSTSISTLIAGFCRRHAARAWEVVSLTLHAALFVITVSLMM